MSLSYEITERTIVNAEKQTELQKWVIAKTYVRFCNLADGIQVTKENRYEGYFAGYSKIKAVVDGTVYELTDSNVGADYWRMLAMVKDAIKMELTATYSIMDGCRSLPENATIDGCDILPDDLIFILREKARNAPDAMDGIFLSCWRADDCDDYQGVLEAYGTCKGNTYSGYIPRYIVDKIPEGKWTTVSNVLEYRSDFNPTDLAYRDANCSEIPAICHELAAIANCDQVYEDETGVEMTLNFEKALLSTQELLHFSNLAARLWRLTEGNAFVEIRVNDISGDFPRILEMKLNPTGNYQLYLQEV